MKFFLPYTKQKVNIISFLDKYFILLKNGIIFKKRIHMKGGREEKNKFPDFFSMF